jgi:hypothetical protein
VADFKGDRFQRWQIPKVADWKGGRLERLQIAKVADPKGGILQRWKPPWNMCQIRLSNAAMMALETQKKKSLCVMPMTLILLIGTMILRILKTAIAGLQFISTKPMLL